MIERCLGAQRSRKVHRALRNCKVTILCLILTVVVLRGIIGAGKFGTPEQDLIEIRNHFYLHFRRRGAGSHQVLEEDGRTTSSSDAFDTTNSRDQHTNDTCDEFRVSKMSFDEEEDEKLDSNTALTLLDQKILDWDKGRLKWLRENPNLPNFVGDNKARVLLVTGSSPKTCKNPAGDHYLRKSLKNKVDYCRIHGIEIFYHVALLDAEMSGFWAKLPLIRTLMLSHPGVELFWWMDSDVIFTDMAFEVPWERYQNYNLVMHGLTEMVYDQKNWIGSNTGSFLLRNCQWSLDILDAWAPMGPKGIIRDEAGHILTKELKGRPAFEGDDQSAIVYLLATLRDKWGDKVYFENEYYLMMEKYHQGLGDHRWPLVTHFVGCKPCAKFGDYPVDRCLMQMDRAFNFGDNQVPKTYGFTHKSLVGKRVKRVQNATSNLLDVKR